MISPNNLEVLQSDLMSELGLIFTKYTVGQGGVRKYSLSLLLNKSSREGEKCYSQTKYAYSKQESYWQWIRVNVKLRSNSLSLHRTVKTGRIACRA